MHSFEGVARLHVGLRDTRGNEVQRALARAREDYSGKMEAMRFKLLAVHQRHPEHCQSTAVSMLLWSARFETAPTAALKIAPTEALPW